MPDVPEERTQHASGKAAYVIGFGALLIVVGLGAYLLSGRASVTALIPAFFGLPILGLGTLARSPRHERWAMIGAAALAGLGLMGSASGVPKFITLLLGGTIERPLAAGMQSLMAFFCTAFLAFAILTLRRPPNRE